MKKIIILIFLIFIVFMVNEYFFSFIKIEGTSMNPTLYDGEIMILDKINPRINKFRYHRFDIVAIEVNGKHIVKRIIGLPGEKIVYENSVLYINDKEIDDPYNGDFQMDGIFSELDDNEYYVLGDNRNVSEDSRSITIGIIRLDQILGITNQVLYPFDKYGKVE